VMSWMAAMSVKAVQWQRESEVRREREAEIAMICWSVMQEGKYGKGLGAWQSLVPAMENERM